MTIEQYRRADDLLLKIQRVEELIEALSFESSLSSKSNISIEINRLSTLVDNSVIAEIYNGLNNSLSRYQKEFEEL